MSSHATRRSVTAKFGLPFQIDAPCLLIVAAGLQAERTETLVRRENAKPLLIRRAQLKPPNVVLVVLEVAKQNMELAVATDAMVMLKSNGEEWANDAPVNDIVGGKTGADAISIAFKDVPAVSSQATCPKTIRF